MASALARRRRIVSAGGGGGGEGVGQASKPAGMSDADWSKVKIITGPLYTSTYIATQGANFAEYDTEFATEEANQWDYYVDPGPARVELRGQFFKGGAFDGFMAGLSMGSTFGKSAIWEAVNFYDRAKIYYVQYLRTGNADYLTRANTLAVDFRDNYVVASSYAIADYWTMMEGLALHYLFTGDTDSRYAVGKVADVFRSTAYYTNVVTAGDVEARQPAYLLKSAILADIIGAPSDSGYTWSTVASYWRGKALAFYNSGTGKYDWIDDGAVGDPARPQKPWQTCLLNNSYMLYERQYGADATLSNAIKGSVDWIDANAYDAGTVGFKYAEFDFTYSFGSTEDSLPTAELNGMMTPSWGYCYAKTGTSSYKTRMLACFDSGNDAWGAYATKAFNQNYQYTNLVFQYAF